jgi:hypothetical protein
MKLHEIAQKPYQFDDIEEWLHKQGIHGYTIRPDGVVDVDGSVSLRGKMTVLPIQFGKVTNEFSYNDTSVTSLKGAPYYIGQSFYCSRTKLRSLSGIDKIIKHVGGSFYCTDVQPTHLLGLLLI